MQAEHGTFTPLIFTTSGAMGHKFQKYQKSLAGKIRATNGEIYEEVMQYICRKISFLLLRSTLLCLGDPTAVKGNTETRHDGFSLCLNELNLKE